MKLFCLPFAGGSAQLFLQWRKDLDRSIDLFPIELPGRGKRLREEYYVDFHQAVEDITNRIVEDLDDRPFAIFGHSLGALLAYEVTTNLIQRGYNAPDFLFISAMIPPHLYKNEIVSNLNDNVFLEKIAHLGGTPDQFFSSPELIQFFLPIFRADFNLLETYKQINNNSSPLPSNLIVFSGMNDHRFNNDQAWREYTNGNFERYVFNGGHFFIKDEQPEVLRVINKILARNKELVTYTE
jgi:medium-chain acyl-[acyl-carrier-protein] hydrolase